MTFCEMDKVRVKSFSDNIFSAKNEYRVLECHDFGETHGIMYVLWNEERNIVFRKYFKENDLEAI